MANYLMLYRFMNVLHLLDDELEHELKIRKVVCSSGEPRHTKRTKLRYVLRKQREEKTYNVEGCEDLDSEVEINQIDEKLAAISVPLENKKVRKAMLPQFQTRLIHLYFRLMRLKERKDTEGLEGICCALLSDYFALPPTETPQDNNSQVDLVSSSDDDSTSVNEGDLEDDESDQEKEEDQRKKRYRERKEPRSPKTGKSGQQSSQSEDLVKVLIEKMEEMMTEKLSRLNLGRPASLPSSGSRKSREKVAEEKQKASRKTNQDKRPSEKKGKKPRKERIPSDSPDERTEEDEPEGDNVEEFCNDDFEESEAENVRGERHLRRRPRPVSDWKLRYDGKDEGRNLNKFLTEVEFLAKAEGIGKQTLFNEAIHLFSGEARAWFIEGRKNRDFRNWNEMVTELKMEYQLPDLDYHYELQASQRRQRRSEKFQDFYNSVKEIFDRMSEPPSEQRMFDIMFRNLRSDYKNSLLVKGVRSLRTLKVWGRKLDSANWFLYRSKDGEQNSRSSQVNEVSRRPGQEKQQFEKKNWRERPSSGNQNWKSRSDDKSKFRGNDDTRNQSQKKECEPKPEAKKNPQKLDSQEGSSSSTLDKRIAAYKVPDKSVCFNCRGNYHHFNACLKERELFCYKCGFHDFSADRCPFCAKNGHRSP